MLTLQKFSIFKCRDTYLEGKEKNSIASSEQNIERLTCLGFQASYYLSPSPKGREKEILLLKKLLKIASEPRAQVLSYHYCSWSNLFGYYNLFS